MAHAVVLSSCSSGLRRRLSGTTGSVPNSSAPCSGNCCNFHRSVGLGSSVDLTRKEFAVESLRVSTSISRNHRARVQLRASAEAERDVEIVQDEEWEELMKRQSAKREEQRKEDRKAETSNGEAYQTMTKELQKFPLKEVKQAKKLVASLIKAGEKVEEMIEEAADTGELTPLVLLVIKNRLALARHDDERAAMQALDLLYRRVETEILSRQASPSFQLLNELLHLHDGLDHEEWLRRSRRIMLQVFPPEDAFSILGGPQFDLRNTHGPIEMPEEEDDILLRIDFIREVDEFLTELEAQPEIKPVQGFDAASIGIRLGQEERIRAVDQVRDLRKLAINLQR